MITYGCFFHLKRTRDLCYTHNLQGLPRGDVSSAKSKRHKLYPMFYVLS